MQYPEPLAKLIESYTKLPGIGQKTATRLAFYTLGMQEDDVSVGADIDYAEEMTLFKAVQGRTEM